MRKRGTGQVSHEPTEAVDSAAVAHVEAHLRYTEHFLGLQVIESLAVATDVLRLTFNDGTKCDVIGVVLGSGEKYRVWKARKDGEREAERGVIDQ